MKTLCVIACFIPAVAFLLPWESHGTPDAKAGMTLIYHYAYQWQNFLTGISAGGAAITAAYIAFEGALRAAREQAAATHRTTDELIRQNGLMHDRECVRLEAATRSVLLRLRGASEIIFRKVDEAQGIPVMAEFAGHRIVLSIPGVDQLHQEIGTLGSNEIAAFYELCLSIEALDHESAQTVGAKLEAVRNCAARLANLSAESLKKYHSPKYIGDPTQS